MRKKDREEKDRIVRAGCVVCNRLGVQLDDRIQIHHIRRLATSKKRDKSPMVGLCYTHHIGLLGIHQIGRSTWESYFGEELSYIKDQSA